jgi:hypothetical protein
MRVRAGDEMVARKVVPTFLRAPSAVEIRLANEGTALLFEGAIVTSVGFSLEEDSIELIENVRTSELTSAARLLLEARKVQTPYGSCRSGRQTVVEASRRRNASKGVKLKKARFLP